MRRTLVVMANAPIPGRVKMRLCPPLDPPCAARLHEQIMLDVLDKASSVPDTELAIAYAPDGTLPFFTAAAPDASAYVLQSGDTVGERIANLFDQFCEHDRAVVLIRTDSPTLPAQSLEMAFDVLASGEVDMVLGPARDGHCYLIGMTEPHSEIVKEVVWTGPSVCRRLVDRAAETGLGWYLLPEWYEVETPEDLRDLREELLDDDREYSAAGCTREFIRSLVECGAI